MLHCYFSLTGSGDRTGNFPGFVLIRAHRTLVFDDSRVYGDPALQALAAGRLPEPAPSTGPAGRISGILGLIALVGIVVAQTSRSVHKVG